MRIKEILKKCMWVLPVVLTSFLMIRVGHTASGNIRIEGDPTFHYSVALLWEILKGIAAILPAWLLSLLGLARAFLGENWFPFAEKIPVAVTKCLLAVSAVLLVAVTIASAVYSEYTRDSFPIQYVMENRFAQWQSVSAWVLFYSIVLYIEQWCLQRNCCRLDIRKKQVWAVVTIFLSCMIAFFLDCVVLWHIPLSRVDSPNHLEDYLLWWFCAYCAVLFLPIWFFSARKTLRLFKNDAKWLTLATIVPRSVTPMIALAAAGLIVQQIQKSRHWNEWIESADLPEYGEAAAAGHTFQAMMWGLVLFYALCLLVKQIRAARRAKHESQYEVTV